MNCRAQLALFDALVFLMIISIASAGLLTALNHLPPEADPRDSEVLSRCHHTLLECCMDASDDRGSDRSPLRIGNALMSRFGADGSFGEFGKDLVAITSKILNASLPASVHWCWVVKSRAAEVSIGEKVPPDRSIVASAIVLSQEPMIESRLLAWRL